MSLYLDALETRDPAVREHALLSALPELIARAQTASGWRARLGQIDPRAITSRTALAQLPLTRKAELKALQSATPPLAGLHSTALSGMRRLYLSPGPLYEPEGRSADWWRFARAMHALGLRAGDIVHNSFSYHLTPAAFMVEAGAERLGCVVIPAGTGQTEQQLLALSTLHPCAYIGTPSFLRILLEKAQEHGLALPHLRSALLGAEALPPSLRQWFVEQGLERVLQVYATADLGCIAYESWHQGGPTPGMLLDEHLLLEIVDPDSGTPLPDGAIGEVVLTSFNPDYPLIRFATGDLSAVLPGHSPCGRTNVRLAGWLGRTDQTTKVRGMFVHPSHITQLCGRHPEVLHARLIVSGAMAQDEMCLHCEVESESEALRTRVQDELRALTKLRGTVQFCPPGSLPQDGTWIEDQRSYR